jgi:two-component system cell cycle sensor histidine kinase/response regulator CckA
LNGTETVLLAEDEPLVRAVVATALGDQDYNILETTNGVEGLQIAQEHIPGGIQLLISDIIMPPDGWLRIGWALQEAVS